MIGKRCVYVRGATLSLGRGSAHLRRGEGLQSAKFALPKTPRTFHIRNPSPRRLQRRPSPSGKRVATPFIQRMHSTRLPQSRARQSQRRQSQGNARRRKDEAGCGCNGAPSPRRRQAARAAPALRSGPSGDCGAGTGQGEFAAFAASPRPKGRASQPRRRRIYCPASVRLARFPRSVYRTRLPAWLPSSSGPGRRPLTAKTGVRFP